MSKPIAKYRSGSVSCAVWQNDSGMESVTFQHSYKDKNTNEWKNTGFIPDYKLSDLLAVVTALTVKAVLKPEVKKPTQTYPQQENIPPAIPQPPINDNSTPF